MSSRPVCAASTTSPPFAAPAPALLLAVALLGAFCGAARAEEPPAAPAKAPRETICPRLGAAPNLDGKLDDECWKQAAAIQAFTQPQSDKKPPKAVEARIGFDEKALYVGFVCEEPNPENIRAEAKGKSSEVWQDDCVEVWVRTTDSALEFDQFIANTLGTRQSLRKRQVPDKGAWDPAWRVAVNKGEKEWTAEIAIPFADLGLAAPARGEMFQMKLGREDYASKPAAWSTWPPRSKYAGSEGYAPVYFESSNLLANPDMSERPGDKIAGWSFTQDGKDAALFASAKEGEKNVIRLDAPGRYCGANQDLKLKPNALYRLEARVKGAAGVYLRARTMLKEGGAKLPHTAVAKPSEDFAPVEVIFPTGPKGDALIIVGTEESQGKGPVTIADLRVAREVGLKTYGPPIPLAADADQPAAATKLLVSDCRALRGFVGTPVDGSTASLDWAGEEHEYNEDGNAWVGVGYTYKGNDGLHVTLGDKKGFNAVAIRGGAKVKMYRDCDAYDQPGKGVLLSDFPGRTKTSLAYFKEPVMSDRVSFFELTDGYLANVSFYRLQNGRGDLPEPARLAMGAADKPDEPNLAARFPSDGRKAFKLEAGDGRADAAIRAPAGAAVHFLSAPLEDETPLAAIGLDFVLRDCPSPAPFTAAVQDPIAPRLELFGADFELDKPGRVRLILDFPDQVIPKGSRLWLTLTFGAAATIAGADGKAPAVELYRVARERALPEALAHRKLLMKTFFCALSEARPWNGWYTDEAVEKSMKGKYGTQLRELVKTIDHCREIGPEDPTVKQYYEWVWRQHRKWRADRKRGVYLDSSHAKVDAVPGAPEWAVVARQAWLLAREVPKWWLDNRLVPTGELGGEVGDDTDQYANYADLPMFENDGVTARLYDAAERLADTAESETLELELNKRTMDPLHAYEEGVNHLGWMAWWHYGDPVYFERCLVNTSSTEKLTIVTPKGHRHFKSQSLGSADLRFDRKTDVDGQAHPQMWQPACEVIWYNANPKALKLLREYADGWLEHMEPGKYPTAVEVATEKPTEVKPTPFAGGYGGQGAPFVFLYEATREEKYIKPYLEYLAGGKTDLGGFLIADLYRLHGLKDVRDKVAEALKGKGAADLVFNGSKASLIEALKVDIAEMQNYGILYTTAELFTDRVFLSPLHNAAFAYSGGYGTRNKVYHSNAVSWSGFGTEYAALVLTARPDAFKALLYNFAGEPRTGKARFWGLDHGRYKLTFGPDANGDDAADKAEREETVEVVRGEAIPLTIPPKAVAVLELAQAEKLDDLRLRADLALSPREVQVKGATVSGVAHNIGSGGVESFEVALVDATGAVKASKTLGKLEAPLDLAPRKIEFALDGLPADAKGWAVVIDPGNKVPEIYEGNNRIEIVRP